MSSLSAANVCAQSISLRIWGVEAPENLCLRSSTVSGFPERIFKTKKVVPGSYMISSFYTLIAKDNGAAQILEFIFILVILAHNHQNLSVNKF